MKVYTISGHNMQLISQKTSVICYDWPVIPVPPSPPDVTAVVLTQNQSTTNTVGTGDATLLSLPVVGGKQYFVRARLIINALRMTFTLGGSGPYFGNGDDAAAMHFFG